jgi:DNA-binding MarR family transcriptional regulator
MEARRAQLSRGGFAEAGLPDDPALFKVMSEIIMIAHLADTAFSRVLPPGVTTAQFGVLNRLVRLRRRETTSQLAAAFQVAQPTMTSTVRRLRDKALVDLEQDSDDLRSRFVVITPAGEAVRDTSVDALSPYLSLFAAEAPDLNFEALLEPLTRLRTFLDQRR